MICRYWRGWTTPQNADAYQSVLTEQVIPMIESRRIPGFQRIDMMRRELGDEVEFATIMWFESIDAIRAFVGDDYEVAHVPEVARKVLKRWDERSAHYELFGQREQP